MEIQLFEWLMNLPNYFLGFGNWLITPINEQYFNISPLGLFGIGGGAFLIALIGVHVVRLFV